MKRKLFQQKKSVVEYSMDVNNATRFINSYNKIDAQLRAMYNFKASQSFSDIIRRTAEINLVIQKYEDELIGYARLRNAIVHQTIDGKIIAVPCDDVVAEIEKIEKMLCTPPTIGQTLKDKKIVSVDDSISIRNALLLIIKSGYSNIPVYRGSRMVGILNNRNLIKTLGACVTNGVGLDEFVRVTPVSEVLREGEIFEYYKYVSKSDPLQKIIEAFSENKKLLAVVVSENGIIGERIVNFLTPVDLVEVNKILEDY